MLRSSVARIGVRTFSNDVKTHTPPKRLHGVTGRYAGAVYTAASKAGLLDKVETELLAFSSTLSKSPNFAAFLSNPTIPRGEKASVVGQLLGDKKFSNITTNLLMTLSANGRIGEAGKVVNAFVELMDTARGNVTVTVISAEPLKKPQSKDVETAVHSLVGKGKKVELTFQTDPSILGGLQIIVGDKVMDLSVAARVTQLNIDLEGADA
eukprot:CAMPEP_0174821192 /NCGR_PEP_ID=MMETSP1107-20130205/5938_1 /TAXON_ID=36770 /ORGANISM="Paraphysomonas vestita, Strain GFlagA" /LENGTH=208 /DNA_ID=CAMNT_0016037949 /DNA_START=50 /DNA_END=676 /DNA_ORIENTATION=-